jgi:Peptidase S46
MKKIISVLCTLALLTSAHAHEGMWLLQKLKQVNEADMQRLGFKLTAADIYDLNKSSMKDAVARLGGGFCTGEIVSAEGLMLTNHHCGYDAIQGFSTVEHDYLTDGFWAMTRAQELNVEGLEVSFLQRIDDVTPTVLSELTEDMTEEARQSKIQELAAKLEKDAEAEGKHLLADFKTMFDGNEFYLFVYKSYPDVRLVGAPPSAIGKFGGDTDNWMWPRHTGDYSMFRVYTGPDGEPAEYAEGNVPMKSKWHFPISLDGVKDGDFTMVMGFPGRTNRFMCSAAVKNELDIKQPSIVRIRTELLDTWKQHMDADAAVRIKYASKYASTSNYWKYFIGQQKGLKRLKVYDQKKQIENDLSAWVDADPTRKAKYSGWSSDLNEGFAERAKYEKALVYLQEAAFGSEAIEMGFNLLGLRGQLQTEARDQAKVTATAAEVREATSGVWKDYDAATDRHATAVLFGLIMKDLTPAEQPDLMNTIRTKYKGDVQAWADALFASSILADRGRFEAFLAKPSLKVLNKDIGMQAVVSIDKWLSQVRSGLSPTRTRTARGYRLMVAAMREKDPTRMWYPNANSTLRLTYGQIGDYKPGDAMHYDFATTADGILEKEDNTNEEFVVPKKQNELLKLRDYGRYADASGELITCFISDNDITGGNSGSPVINGNGELIGIAFDGNWEAMSGDIAFENELQRTISVDIRYVLWTIDKLAGAKHLVDEMTLLERRAAPASTDVGLPVPTMAKQN